MSKSATEMTDREWSETTGVPLYGFMSPGEAFGRGLTQPTMQLKTFAVFYPSYVGQCHACTSDQATTMLKIMANRVGICLDEPVAVYAREFDPTSPPQLELRTPTPTGYAND